MYNSFLIYCRELATGTVSLTGDRAQGDDSKHDSHYHIYIYLIVIPFIYNYDNMCCTVQHSIHGHICRYVTQ